MYIQVNVQICMHFPPGHNFSYVRRGGISNAFRCVRTIHSAKHFFGPKNQEFFFSQKSGGNQKFFRIKSNDFNRNQQTDLKTEYPYGSFNLCQLF